MIGPRHETAARRPRGGRPGRGGRGWMRERSVAALRRPPALRAGRRGHEHLPREGRPRGRTAAAGPAPADRLGRSGLRPAVRAAEAGVRPGDPDGRRGLAAERDAREGSGVSPGVAEGPPRPGLLGGHGPGPRRRRRTGDRERAERAGRRVRSDVVVRQAHGWSTVAGASGSHCAAASCGLQQPESSSTMSRQNVPQQGAASSHPCWIAAQTPR